MAKQSNVCLLASLFRSFSSMNLKMPRKIIFSCKTLAAVLITAYKWPYSRMNEHVTTKFLVSLERLTAFGALEFPANMSSTCPAPLTLGTPAFLCSRRKRFYKTFPARGNILTNGIVHALVFFYSTSAIYCLLKCTNVVMLYGKAKARVCLMWQQGRVR